MGRRVVRFMTVMVLHAGPSVHNHSSWATRGMPGPSERE